MTERIDIGSVLGRVVELYREQAGVLLPAALIVFIPIALISGALVAAGGGVLAIVGVVVVAAVGNGLYQATTVEAIRDIQDGRRDLDLGGLFRSAFQVLGPVILASIVVGFGIGLGLILLIVPGLVLMAWWAVTIPSVVIERRSPIEALGRSRGLVKGHGWQVFGVVVILAIVQEVARRILIAVFSGIGDFVGGAIGLLIANVLFAPLGAIAATILYLRLRQIKEGTAPPAGADPTAPATGAGAPPAVGSGAGTSLPGVPGTTGPMPVPPPPPPGSVPPPPPPPPTAPPGA